MQQNGSLADGYLEVLVTEPGAGEGAGPSHWRDCHFADGLSPSLLKHLLQIEGGAAEQQSRRRLAGPCVLDEDVRSGHEPFERSLTGGGTSVILLASPLHPH